jgi:hypothetical protein
MSRWTPGVRGGHHLCRDCTIWGIGQKLLEPLLAFLWMQKFHLQLKIWIFFERKELISLIIFVSNFNLCNLYNKLGCQVVSKAFSISKNTAAIDIFLEFKVTWPINLIHCSVVLWLVQKPNWLAISRSSSWVCLCTIFRLTFKKFAHSELEAYWT